MSFHLRRALPSDVRSIYSLVTPYAQANVLISKELINYFESIQEFIVAEEEDESSTHHIIGCGALHVMWDDIAEVRTLAVNPKYTRKGVGSQILAELLQRARDMGLKRTFCLTFEVEFFARHGFHAIEGTPVGADIFTEMVLSHDDGIREFLDLASVKPNTLGNTRMLIDL